MSTRTKKRLVLLAAICVAVAVAVPTLAAATIPNNGVIYACYTKSGGTLHVIDQSVRNCNPGQTSLSWNVAGQTGAQGPEGPPGATGATGPAGPAGSTTDYEVTDESSDLSGVTLVARVFVPAGTYFAMASGDVSDPNNDAAETCSLGNGSTNVQLTNVDTFGILGGISISKRDASASFALSGSVTLTSFGSIQVNCSSDDDPNASAYNVDLDALPIGTVL
jgi:hypothetical protein